jgi:hypothetical protein
MLSSRLAVALPAVVICAMVIVTIRWSAPIERKHSRIKHKRCIYTEVNEGAQLGNDSKTAEHFVQEFLVVHVELVDARLNHGNRLKAS